MKSKFKMNWERLFVWSFLAGLVIAFWYSVIRYLYLY